MRPVLMLLALLPWSAVVLAAPDIDAPAPDFVGTATNGETVRLSDLRGRRVILEWTNHLCPYVGKHYGGGDMQTLQRETTGAGMAWLSVISSAPGTQGHVTAAEADALTRDRDAAPTAVLLDPEGAIGRLYGARVTPHMYVVDEAGRLRYMGAIDDRPTDDRADIPGATNHVRAALADLDADRPVGSPVTRAYGCTVKYR